MNKKDPKEMYLWRQRLF